MVTVSADGLSGAATEDVGRALPPDQRAPHAVARRRRRDTAVTNYFYVSPEQLIKDRAEFAQKGIARGRSIVAAIYDEGVVMVAENPSASLNKISEVYDRIAFAGVGKYNEFDRLARGGHPLGRLAPASPTRARTSTRGRWRTTTPNTSATCSPRAKSPSRSRFWSPSSGASCVPPSSTASPTKERSPTSRTSRCSAATPRPSRTASPTLRSGHAARSARRSRTPSRALAGPDRRAAASTTSKWASSKTAAIGARSQRLERRAECSELLSLNGSGQAMLRRIYGVETEYGITFSLRGQRRLSPDEVSRFLFRKVVAWGRS